MHKGLIIKDLIKRSDYTQKEIASAIKISPQALSVYLKEKDLKDSVINDVCEFLGIDKDEHFSSSAELTDGEAGGVFQKKYEELLMEKGKWLEEKHSFVNQLGDVQKELHELRSEIFRKDRKIASLEEELSEFKTNKNIGKTG